MRATRKLDPEHVAIIEPVKGSDIPVHLMYVETIDGLYAPIGLRTPHSGGPFPLILFAAGNGGGGMAVVRDFTQNRSWTQEQFLAAGYAVAWMRYRAEVDYAYDRIGKLIEDRRQRRQLLNRGPLEYEDVISIIKYVKTLPSIDPDRIGYLGMSHGGEMAFKIAAEYAGVRAMVAKRTGVARVPQAETRRHRADRSCDRPAQCREDADARAGKGARQDHRRRRHAADRHHRDADLGPGPRQRRAPGNFPRLLRSAQGSRQGLRGGQSYDHDEHGFIYVRRQ